MSDGYIQGDLAELVDWDTVQPDAIGGSGTNAYIRAGGFTVERWGSGFRARHTQCFAKRLGDIVVSGWSRTIVDEIPPPNEAQWGRMRRECTRFED